VTSLRSQAGGVTLLHIAVVGMSLAMTLGAWLYSKHQVDLQIENRFETAKKRTINLIIDRMSRYEDALWSGVAHLETRKSETTPQDWSLFANALKIEKKYPGVNGIGVIYYVDQYNQSQYIAARAAELREFSVYPPHNQEFMLPITFIEPPDINARAVGLDVAHEANRRTGLLASRDSGTAQITGPIVLVQDSNHTPGFLFYTPFYKGPRPDSLQERKDRFAGAVYAPFVVHKLVEGLFLKEFSEVLLSIRDGDQVIYDEQDSNNPLYDNDPMFSDTVELDVYGRKWTLDIRTNKIFRSQNSAEQPMLILIGGLIIEILVFSLLATLARSNSRIHTYAYQLTENLRAKTEHLEQANAEIQQFVYIASHDLKTPVRGIGFLAEVIEEDLEEIFGSLESHTEIKAQFKMIRERVNRMNDLTDGIMAFSRIGNFEVETDPALRLDTLIEDCVTDFRIAPSQIRLSSDVSEISCDSHNFRRVIENLIGNAFKYHPDPQSALVDLTLVDLGNRIKVSVRDNGKGIAPEFHEKIFQVFQTLRKGDDPESTGIGLAIVKKAVQRHGYTVWVSSSEKNGAEFTFYWPKTYMSEDSQTKKVA